jgi:hypothetical protein
MRPGGRLGAGVPRTPMWGAVAENRSCRWVFWNSKCMGDLDCQRNAPVLSGLGVVGVGRSYRARSRLCPLGQENPGLIFLPPFSCLSFGFASAMSTHSRTIIQIGQPRGLRNESSGNGRIPAETTKENEYDCPALAGDVAAALAAATAHVARLVENARAAGLARAAPAGRSRARARRFTPQQRSAERPTPG